MLRDVFYFGSKPNAHPREQFAESLTDAREKATTRDFWIINEFCDYRNFDWDFDFEFLPDEDVWAEDHNNVWPSQHQKDSGTWLCPKEHSDIIIYRADVEPVIRRNIKNDNWVELDLIDHTKFDFSWHPDPTDPPYIYKWGCKFFPAELQHVLEYRVPGATQEKYMGIIVELLPQIDRWVEVQNIDKNHFDMSWRPSPLDPPYIYIWGNKYIDGRLKPTLEYHCEGAIDRKYMPELLTVLPEWDRWKIVKKIEKDSFDFSWRPDPREPPMTYVFGNNHYDSVKMPTIIYTMPEGHDTKYVDDIKAKLAPEIEKYEHLEDSYLLDYSWQPDPDSPPYIYVWGNQWNKPEDKISIQYVVEGATEYKYMTERAIRKPCTDNWIIPEGIDVSDIDFSWEPSPHAPPYIYEFATQWQKTGGPQYVVPGATEKTYIDTFKAKKLPLMDNWTVPDNIDASKFDFSWHPDATSPAYKYVFATQWAFSGGPVYEVEGATETKYVDDQLATALPDMTNWIYDDTEIDVNTFDFSWHPYVEDQPYIYQFGTQWWETGGPRYITPGADSSSPVKYIDTRILKATTLTKTDNWEYSDNIDTSKFDFSWVPHPEDPPYIYVFGNQWHPAEKMPTVKYIVHGATEHKYVSTISATLKPNMDNWVISENLVVEYFDFSWVPDPYDPPYNYVFGNQWYPAEEMATVTYVSPGATEKKFVTDIKAKLGKNLRNWQIQEGIDVSSFDFSWLPHPDAPPYIYQFGTKLDNNDGPIYITPNNNGELVYLPRIEIDNIETKEVTVGKYYIETTLAELVKEHPNEVFWALRKNINYDQFDFDWRPGTVEVAWELEYVHVFGSVDSELTHTYFVSANHFLEGHTSFKYVEEVSLTSEILSEMFVQPDVFYVDRGNPEAASRFETLRAKFGNKIQKTRYLNSWVDTIRRCTNRATNDLLWVLNSELDYSDFNFNYYPNPWQMKMVHVFGTQWSHWGTTFMVNRESFAEDTKYINIIEHLSNLNFVKDIRAKATQCVHDIVLIDFGNKETESVVNLLQSKSSGRTVSVVKYNESYLNSLKEIVRKQQQKKEHHLWVCSSVCDYNDFDFSYICDPFAKDQLHVFPTGLQKFGDTFFLDVNHAREIVEDLEKLDDFVKVNYNGAIKTKRLPEPTILVGDDTHVNAVKHVTDFPYYTLITHDNSDIKVPELEPICLWSPETKNIQVTTTGATRIVVPAEVKDYVKKELYEYPYIKRSPKLTISKPINIVFLSNGEVGADENWEHLLNVTKGLANRVVRVDGVNGRAAAYHAAAEASETPWMFTVFAKLKVSPKFDWNWQPDRMQAPKHYIFHAKNPVNGLVYGHQAMIAYNKKLTLANEGKGLDFTLDDEHEVVPLISGTAHYNTDEFSTWRTAFREVIKLKADTSDVSKDRLDAWLNKAEGDFAQYSIQGALDADEYYDEVGGDFDKLKLSYEWEWLRNRFEEM